MPNLTFAGRELSWSSDRLDASLTIEGVTVTVRKREEAGARPWQAGLTGCTVAANGCWRADPQEALDALRKRAFAEYRALQAVLGRTD